MQYDISRDKTTKLAKAPEVLMIFYAVSSPKEKTQFRNYQFEKFHVLAQELSWVRPRLQTRRMENLIGQHGLLSPLSPQNPLPRNLAGVK
jgi:hypothetical protein